MGKTVKNKWNRKWKGKKWVIQLKQVEQKITKVKNG